MRETIVKINCDVCKQEGAKETEVVVVCMGNEYEYGVTSWENKPIRERLMKKTLDMCDTCANRLVQEPLHYTMGFYRDGDYYFPKVGKSAAPSPQEIERLLKEYADILLNVTNGELDEEEAGQAEALRLKIIRQATRQ